MSVEQQDQAGHMVLDSTGVVLHANPAAGAILGVQAASLAGARPERTWRWLKAVDADRAADGVTLTTTSLREAHENALMRVTLVGGASGWLLVSTSTADDVTAVSFTRVPALLDNRPGHDGESAGMEKSILVVEDDQQVRDLIAHLLQRRGFRIWAASNGADAIAEIDHGNRPDLLLTDLVVPGMAAVDLVSQVNARAPEARVLLMSGYPEVGLEGCRVDGFLNKPFSPSELGEAIDRALSKIR